MTDTSYRPLVYLKFRRAYYNDMEILELLGLYETLAVIFCPELLSIIQQTKKDIKSAIDDIEKDQLILQLQKLNGMRIRFCIKA